jgi:hypothetical protein
MISHPIGSHYDLILSTFVGHKKTRLSLRIDDTANDYIAIGISDPSTALYDRFNSKGMLCEKSSDLELVHLRTRLHASKGNVAVLVTLK